MKIKCSKCGKVLKKKGALVFSPPYPEVTVGQSVDLVRKYHICADCWPSLMNWLKTEKRI